MSGDGLRSDARLLAQVNPMAAAYELAQGTIGREWDAKVAIVVSLAKLWQAGDDLKTAICHALGGSR